MANTASTTNPAVSIVNKPPIGTTRSRKFRLDVLADLGADFCGWNAAYIKTFNEAVRMANLATYFDDENLSEYELYRPLVTSSSPLVVSQSRARSLTHLKYAAEPSMMLCAFRTCFDSP